MISNTIVWITQLEILTKILFLLVAYLSPEKEEIVTVAQWIAHSGLKTEELDRR